VGGREVGVKCCGMQGCCVGGRTDVRSCRKIVHTVASTKTNRVGAAARQSEVRPPSLVGVVAR